VHRPRLLTRHESAERLVAAAVGLGDGWRPSSEPASLDRPYLDPELRLSPEGPGPPGSFSRP
jgi:hypothetical protein